VVGFAHLLCLFLLLNVLTAYVEKLTVSEFLAVKYWQWHCFHFDTVLSISVRL